MSTIVGVVAMSHSPFWDSREFAGEDGVFLAAAARARAAVDAARPTAIVVIGPDHFRNFFYDVMPAFCIGTDHISSFGDYRTPREDLPPASTLARSMHASLQAQGFDPALSLHMGVDHGITQPYALFAPQLDLPLVPIMISSTGPARPSLRRCADLGRAIGTAVRESEGERVLIVGSGGLSHWLPPTDPDHHEIDDELRGFVIDGRASAREVQSSREARILASAATNNGRVNSAWDAWFLDHVARGSMDAVLELSDADIDRDAGNGGHEIRTWITAVAAGGVALEVYGYEAQPAWLTGTACAAAFNA
ncbi:MAG: 2,3-dihydroxyphenylpropionate 1,2-dioxygenase [Acidimicrobiales bacterium]